VTRSGARRQTSSATRPPMEWPASAKRGGAAINTWSAIAPRLENPENDTTCTSATSASRRGTSPHTVSSHSRPQDKKRGCTRQLYRARVARRGVCAYIGAMGRNIQQAVREACLWMPETEEFISHGSPNFRVRGKSFATYAVNHHGDGRVALWLNSPPGAQQAHVEAAPAHYFVPPYVGPRGWLGVVLDKGLGWKQIAARVREAYENVAPAPLRADLGRTPRIAAPTQTLSAAAIDPMQSTRGRALLKLIRGICLKLPETREVLQFGYPVWQAGKKTYVWARASDGRLSLSFWVGVEAQGLLTSDERYRIPAYMGHNGWIELDTTHHCDRTEVTALTLQSYRHFALRRMLQQLPAD
jgi:predicted DNA-binding protein (MmcQ/YjbR family)